MEDSIIYVTKEGYEQYVKMLEKQEEILSEHLKTRADYGTNANDNYRTGIYDELRRSYLSNIKDTKRLIKRLQVINEENVDANIVNINDIVTIKFDNEEDVERVKIVGGIPEVDRENGLLCITINSPMGKALYKKKIGETVSYQVKNNIFSINILSKENASNKQEEPEL